MGINNYDGDIAFWTKSSERMRVTWYWNIWIWTQTPDTLLHIVRNSAEIVKLQNSASNGGSWQFKVWGGGWLDWAFTIVDKTGWADNHRFTILPSWNVWIGTTAPATSLHINNWNYAAIQLWNDVAWQGYHIAKESTDNSFGIWAWKYWAGTRVLTLLQNWNVWIWTTSPDQTLSVNWNASKVWGGSWATFSDRRLKDINYNYTRGLSEVLKINPISYNYKKDNPLKIDSQISHIGVVAQEIEKVIPEAITKTKSGYLMVDNDPIIWALLNSVKEQQKQIEAQQKQIDELKNLIKK